MKLQNRSLTLIIILAVLSFHLVNARESSHQPVTPTEHVKAVINEILPYVRSEDMDSNAKWKKIRRILHQHFDFRSMTQNALANHWKSASWEEQHQLTVAFSEYLELIYRASIEAYTIQRIEFLSEQVQGKYADVSIDISDDSGSTPVIFRLHDQDDRWMAYDVLINGVSIIDNYKLTFNTILSTEGINGMMEEITEKIEDYKQLYGTAPDRDSPEPATIESTP